MKHDRVQILDHGYVELVESWGSDERIIEAARMSTQKGFEGWGPKHKDCCDLPQSGPMCHGKPGDEKLLRYLYENNHATPFEMAGFTIEVQAPLFVFREWHRHRTQSYNEMSARYAPLPDLNYLPSVERFMRGGGHLTKQAAGTGEVQITEHGALAVRLGMERMYKLAEEHYQAALACGTPKELARLVLPVGRYSRMRASANLRNWLGFLTLRTDPKAQWEIQQYAIEVERLVCQTFPRTHALFAAARKARA